MTRWEELPRLLQSTPDMCDPSSYQRKIIIFSGDVFAEESLRNLMIRAIRYGDQPDARRRLTQQMAIFSRHSAVLKADGTPASVKTALQLINRFLAEDDFNETLARNRDPRAFWTSTSTWARVPW